MAAKWILAAVTAAVLAAGPLPATTVMAKPPAEAGKAGKAAEQGPRAGNDGQLLDEQEGAVAEAIIEAITGRNIDLDGREPGAPGGEAKGLPPGLAKRGQLPPGLQRHLDRTGQLPPGLQKRVSGGVAQRMPGAQVTFEGTKAIVRDRATGEIVKVIRDVLELAR